MPESLRTAVHDAALGIDVPALGVGHELQAEDGVGATIDLKSSIGGSVRRKLPRVAQDLNAILAYFTPADNPCVGH